MVIALILGRSILKIGGVSIKDGWREKVLG